MDIKKRIEALESRILKNDDDRIEAIFYTVVDATAEGGGRALPVYGWKYDELKVMRASGETDEELDQRAILEAQPFLRDRGAIPVFHPITEW